MLHGKSLYFYSEGAKKVELIDKNCSNLCYLNDENFLYMITEEK